MKSRTFRFLLVTVLALGIMPFGSGLAFATRAIDGEYPVVVAPGGQVQPEVEWPYVVFKDGRADEMGIYNAAPYIQIYNMETGLVFPATAGNMGRWEQSNPSINGGRVVYSDKRNNDDSQCDIYMYDIATGKESLVCSATAGQGNPSIYGDIVAWVDWRAGGTSHIYMKDLSTGIESQVSTGTAREYEPDVWGDYITYISNMTGPWEVYLYQISTGERIQVSGADVGTEYEATVDDGKVTWVSDSTDRIYLYDIESGVTEIVSESAYYKRNPDMQDGWISWHEYNASGYYEVHAYNMASEEETIVVHADAEKYAGRTATGGGWVFWHDHRTGDGDDEDSDLYGLSLDNFFDAEQPATQAMPLQGLDRYQTAIDVCQQAFPDGSETLVISTGENWPDALAGASLAGAYNAPILLVGNELSAAVAAEITRLNPWQVFILGGDAAVAGAIEDDVADLLTGEETSVVRLGGIDRYETACIVASETVNALGEDWDGTAFATTGNNWPDALAASPLAAWAGYPVFLADSDGFDAMTEQCMDDLGVDGAIVLGGTVAMPLSVLAQVEALGVTEIARVGGDDRYETAAAIADYGVTELGMSYDTLGISTGDVYPDALSAGAVLGEDGFCILLTPGTSLAAPTKASLEDNAEDISQIRFIGGPSAITPTVRSMILSCVY